MITRETKQVIINDLREKITRAEALYVTNLIGLESNVANGIRKNIRQAKGSVVVARNRLIQKAAEGTKSSEIFKSLKGTNAIAFAFKDAPAVAKILHDAKKDNEVIDIKSGMLGEKILDAKSIEALAKLPSRDQMLATLLATFNAPVSAFVRVLDQIRIQKEASGDK